MTHERLVVFVAGLGVHALAVGGGAAASERGIVVAALLFIDDRHAGSEFLSSGGETRGLHCYFVGRHCSVLLCTAGQILENGGRGNKE